MARKFSSDWVVLVVVWGVGGMERGGAVVVVVVVVGGAMVGEGESVGGEVVGMERGEEVEFRRVDVVPVPVPGLGLGVCWLV